MANYGGKEMRDLRKNAAATDAELKGAGSKVGLEIWRVENRRTAKDNPDFGIKRWPKENYGQFYNGDSYIILNTYNPVDPETGKKMNDKLAWDVHFWLGVETSIDERGVAAYKTIEIDDLLDDGPVQHREVQGNESVKFQGYFQALEYMEGGIASGFRKGKVEEEYEVRLIQVRRTKKTVRGIPKPAKASSLNHGDVFILDSGKKVFLWVGKEANAFEKSKGANLVHNIIDRRMGKAKRSDPDKDPEFWNILGGSIKDVKSAEAAEREPEVSLDAESCSLFKLSDASGKLTFTPIVKKGVLSKNMLDSNDVFIVVSNIEIFVWVGARASKEERRNAMLQAEKYLEQSDLPKSTPITRVLEEQPVLNAVWTSCFKK